MRHDVDVKQDHGGFGPVEGFGEGCARMNIVATPSIQNPDKTVLYATNKDVNDENRLVRRWAAKTVNEYSLRGEHEKCFEMVKEFLGPTQSKQFRLHLFYFCFATIGTECGSWRISARRRTWASRWRTKTARR